MFICVAKKAPLPGHCLALLQKLLSLSDRTCVCSSATALQVIEGKCTSQLSRETEQVPVSLSAPPPKCPQIHWYHESCRSHLHLSHLPATAFPLSVLKALKSSLLPLTNEVLPRLYLLQISPVAPISLPFVLIVTFCISFTNLIFLYEMKNQLLHFEGSSQINHSLPTTCQSERWIHCRSSCKQLQLLLPKFYAGWGEASHRCCKTTLVVFHISYCKDNLDNFAHQVNKKKKDWYYLPSYACGLSAPASCLAVCNLNGKSYAMHEPTRLIHLVTAKIAQMKISYVLALTSFGVLDGSARSEQLAEIHLVDISLIH